MIDKGQLNQFHAYFEKRLKGIGIRYVLMKECNDKQLIFVYNKSSLNRYVNLDENKKILEKYGYGGLSIDEMIGNLKFRLASGDFPHEIGVFLGIPPCDVKGYMNCKECIHNGYWKVYENMEIANRLFELYDSSRDAVIEDILNDVSIEKTIFGLRNIYIDQIDILQKKNSLS